LRALSTDQGPPRPARLQPGGELGARRPGAGLLGGRGRSRGQLAADVGQPIGGGGGGSFGRRWRPAAPVPRLAPAREGSDRLAHLDGTL